MDPFTPFEAWLDQCCLLYDWYVDDAEWIEAFQWYCAGKTPQQYVAMKHKKQEKP